MPSIDDDELTQLLKALKVELDGKFPENIVALNACWIDHSSCPYGLPAGKFDDKPSCCIYPAKLRMGCNKLVKILEVFEKEMISDEPVIRVRDDVVAQIHDYIDRRLIRMSDLFSDFIEKDDSLPDHEKLILQAAIMILKKIPVYDIIVVKGDEFRSFLGDIG